MYHRGPAGAHRTTQTSADLWLLPSPSSRRTSLDRVADHLAELERVLEAGHNRAEATALGRIRRELVAVQ